MSPDSVNREPKTDHSEAWDVACFRKDSSNLARCYIEAVRAIREYVAARDSGESQKGWRQLQEIAGAAND